MLHTKISCMLEGICLPLIMSQSAGSSQLIPFSANGALSTLHLGQLAKSTHASRDASAVFVDKLIKAGYLMEEREDNGTTVVSGMGSVTWDQSHQGHCLIIGSAHEGSDSKQASYC